MQIELIQQHCDRPSVFRDWSQRRRPAFHQLCTVTPDYDGRKAPLRAARLRARRRESRRSSYRVAYVDTVADFGFYTEVVEDDPRLPRAAPQDLRDLRQWDGTDPVRLLTRDGYRVPDPPV